MGTELEARTVSTWTAWYALLKDVITEQVKKQADPVITKRREQHYDLLAEIANSFLEGDLTRLRYDAIDDNAGENSEYELDTGESISRKEMIARLTDNVFQSCDKYETYRVMDWLAIHLESEYLSGKHLFAFIEARPIEFIHIVRTLAAGRFFEGKCEVCEHWR